MAAAIVDGMVLNLPDEGAEVFLHQESHLPFVPCNRTRSREFEEKHPSNDADIEQNRLFRLKVKRILGTASRLLNKLKIPFWLSSGTLLGYFRSVSMTSKYSRSLAWLASGANDRRLYDCSAT